MFDQALGLAGAVVSLATSAREALGYLDRVAVIVTDYAMPGETGLWLLERARPVPVILVTGYADLYAKQLATAPFARVLRKPVDPLQLCTVVAAVLGMV
jgi:CheY-like chemotaxis protein